MNLLRQVKRFFLWAKRARPLVLFFSALFFLTALPWNIVFDRTEVFYLGGIPFGFFSAVFALPLLVLYLMTVFVKLAEDIDRHDPELENE